MHTAQHTDVSPTVYNQVQPDRTAEIAAHAALGSVITVTNFKGGTGKSTITVHMAAFLQARQPKAKILLVDADPDQRSVASWSRWRTAYIERTPDTGLTDFDIALMDPGEDLATLRDAVANARKQYDYVLIDAKGTGMATIRALAALSDILLVPAQPSPFDMAALQPLAEMIITSPRKINALIVFNRAEPSRKIRADDGTVERVVLHRDVAESIAYIRTAFNRTDDENNKLPGHEDAPDVFQIGLPPIVNRLIYKRIIGSGLGINEVLDAQADEALEFEQMIESVLKKLREVRQQQLEAIKEMYE